MASTMMSLSVIAMRLRLALLRQKATVDVERLLVDAEYAAEVVRLCHTLGGDCAALAELFIQQRDGLQQQPGTEAAAQPETAEPPLQKASSRFAASRPGTGDRPTLPAEPGHSTAPASGTSTVTGSTGSTAGHDSDDPDSPRNRRYLRGAR